MANQSAADRNYYPIQDQPKLQGPSPGATRAAARTYVLTASAYCSTTRCDDERTEVFTVEVQTTDGMSSYRLELSSETTSFPDWWLWTLGGTTDEVMHVAAGCQHTINEALLDGLAAALRDAGQHDSITSDDAPF